MKKGNVIDLAAYRAKLAQKPAETSPPTAPSLVISDELKSAIEHLIVKLRSQDSTTSSKS